MSSQLIEQLQAEKVKLQAEIAALRANAVPLVVFGSYMDQPTLTINAKGKRPFTLGLSKVVTLFANQAAIVKAINERVAEAKAA